MIKIEKKIIKNKPFYYLTEQVNIGGSFKKIQVYVGKNIPKDLSLYYNELQKKEIDIVSSNLNQIFKLDSLLSIDEYIKIETIRIRLKYLMYSLADYQRELLWRKFAIKFIFESNAIEGSKLSEAEVEAIVRKKYNKSIDKKEIIEVYNSIKVFELIKLGKFELNQRSIIKTHELLTKGLNIEKGYKKVKIIVNNKETVRPGEVRMNMSELIEWWKKQKKLKTHPFVLTALFHRRFEYIHPFTDGNGRIGRFLYVWMLQKSGYGLILFENTNRQSYFSALDQADNNRPRKLYYHCLRAYKRTEKFLSELNIL